MTEYVKDNEGDVWRVDGEELVFHRFDNGAAGNGPERRPRWSVNDQYGPLVPCTEDGTPLTSEVSPDAVRALVAGALLDFATRMTDGWYRDGSSADSLRDQVVESARETAQAVLRGDVQPAEVSE